MRLYSYCLISQTEEATRQQQSAVSETGISSTDNECSNAVQKYIGSILIVQRCPVHMTCICVYIASIHKDHWWLWVWMHGNGV